VTPSVGLPVTLLVGAGNQISYVYHSAPLDDASLAGLVNRYLGIGGTGR
jgi:hypothetical protein